MLDRNFVPKSSTCLPVLSTFYRPDALLTVQSLSSKHLKDVLNEVNKIFIASEKPAE